MTHKENELLFTMDWVIPFTGWGHQVSSVHQNETTTKTKMIKIHNQTKNYITPNSITLFIWYILKHFVQSDWFLPVFISHDRDTVRGAIGMYHPITRMYLAPD